ncbi:conserved hypothetical protein [Pediculus humanus corporis]|uniref:Kinetochore protein NDC80 n=1 Tax=Pediculus humanus subsp. corporis TaxID=121224 RepID=E0VNM7_PEDHC|nr:uncharacterized protein Phum_PHUM338290 [Pediculus humanus corporis]EEB14983.1 conserved hypothetical protein [Pediculus humanus corporis]
MYMQSQSVERPSRIPLRSSSQSGRDRGIPQNQNKQRSKSQATLGSSETPLNHGKFTPQIGSRMTSGASSNASSKKPTYYKDPRNLQDKEFQREASQLVQHYFKEKSPEVLINSSEIKPMTIKMFIAMINHLFEVLGILDKGIEPVRFAASTFEKELPYWMKKLEYPGLITKAWLQTVNVPQYWPHVVGLLSWLVKLCSANSLFNMEEQLNFPEEYLSQWWGTFFFMKSMEAFRYYNEGKEDEYKELCVEVITKLHELNGVSDDIMNELQAEINELEENVKDPVLLADKDAHDELEEHLRVLDSQHQKLLEDVEKEKIYIDELENKTVKSKKNCVNIKIENTKNETEKLKTVVATQSFSVNDIADIQKKTGYLDKEIKCLEKECEDYSQLLSRYDVEALGVRDKILQSSHAFNRNIIQLEQIIVELKKFHIHIDLESENAVNFMEEMVKSLEKLKTEYVERNSKLEEDLIESETNIANKKKKLKELQNAIRNEEIKKEANQLENAKYETLTKNFEKKEKYWLDFWSNVEDKWRAIPDTLESLLETVNKQNNELEEVIKREKLIQK